VIRIILRNMEMRRGPHYFQSVILIRTGHARTRTRT